MINVDIAITQAINSLSGRSPPIDFLVSQVSALAVPALIFLVAIQWWRRANRLHVRHVLVAAGLSFLVGLLFNQLILLFVHRARPYEAGITHLLIARSSDPSFPSDHATATMAIASAFLLHRMRTVGLWFLVAALLVMLSRIYVGTHYASDVLGGAITGFAAAALVGRFYPEGTKLDRVITNIL